MKTHYSKNIRWKGFCRSWFFAIIEVRFYRKPKNVMRKDTDYE